MLAVSAASLRSASRRSGRRRSSAGCLIAFGAPLLQHFFRGGTGCRQLARACPLLGGKRGACLGCGEVGCFGRVVEANQDGTLPGTLARFERNFGDSAGDFVGDSDLPHGAQLPDGFERHGRGFGLDR